MPEWNEWRVQVLQDDSTFLRDNVKILIGRRDGEGFWPVKPLVIILDEVIPDTNHTLAVEPTVISRELAETLFAALGRSLLGIDDPLVEVQRLRRELEVNRRLFEKLIDGIGRLGGSS